MITDQLEKRCKSAMRDQHGGGDGLTTEVVGSERHVQLRQGVQGNITIRSRWGLMYTILTSKGRYERKRCIRRRSLTQVMVQLSHLIIPKGGAKRRNIETSRDRNEDRVHG